MKACCVTGHRDIPDDKIVFIKSELHKEIKAAIDDGFTLFISGFAPGADMIFARLIIELQKYNPTIQLEAALPYPTWFKNRSAEDKDILSKCIEAKPHSQRYTPNCFFVRNRYMANTCERVIAVYDGRKTGGTVKTIQYAAALGRDIRKIEI